MVKTFSMKQTITVLFGGRIVCLSKSSEGRDLYLFASGDFLPDRDTGSFPIYLASDGKAALSISKMTGLLRRVRHLELRHRCLQELVNSERLVLSFLAGEHSPADGLTKSPEHQKMLDNMLAACGLERILESFSDLQQDRAVKVTHQRGGMGLWLGLQSPVPTYRRV